METPELINALRQDLDIEIHPGNSLDKIKAVLAERLSFLINNDFNQLISLLYRTDINEAKLKAVLKENPEQDAALMIAELVIARQLQKIKSRNEFKPGKDISEEERW